MNNKNVSEMKLEAEMIKIRQIVDALNKELEDFSKWKEDMEKLSSMLAEYSNE